MGKLKLVVLDWAGTTVDYGCFAPVAAFDKAFRAFGVQPTIDEIRAPMGMLKRDHIRTMLQMERLAAQWQERTGKAAEEADVEAIYRVFEEKLMESLSDYAVPKPDVIDTVAQLREMGLKIGSTTGYTDSMMEVVVPEAARQGYAPDYWCSPDSVGGFGRPYPYMIFRNMQQLGIADVREVVKVGDTVSDIREGKQAGVLSLGVMEGSSVLGLTQAEFEALSLADRAEACAMARQTFLDAGADDVLQSIRELPAWIRQRHFDGGNP